MPKRSNEFQRLTYAIHKQLSIGAAVTESKLLVDRATKKKREVDVVIETRTGNLKIIISVEVTASTRPADLEWLNKMEGKHKSLPTDKLVLVSKSGFTQSAIDEAETYGIELMSLDEAIVADWTLIVNKLEEVFLGRCHFTPTECRAVLAGEEYQQSNDPIVGPDLMLYNSQGQCQGTLRDIIKQVLKQPAILENIYKRKDRKDIRSFEIEFPVPSGSYLLDSSNTPRKVRALRAKGGCKFLIDSVPLEHHTYGKEQIAFGKVSIPEGEKILSIVERHDGRRTFEITQLP